MDLNQTNSTDSTLITSIYFDLGCLQLCLASFCYFNLTYLLQKTRCIFLRLKKKVSFVRCSSKTIDGISCISTRSRMKTTTLSVVGRLFCLKSALFSITISMVKYIVTQIGSGTFANSAVSFLIVIQSLFGRLIN